jgi:amino acid transporter
VVVVAVVYIGVTLGAQMLVSDHAITASKEVAFIAVGQAALGELGRWAAIVGALFATGSAINATLFSCARLVRDASATGDLPAALGRETHGLPVAAMAFISIAGVAMAMLPGITAVIAFGSASFLAIYTIVNWLQFAMAEGLWSRLLAAVGALACAAAIVALVVELARDDVAGLVVLVALVVLIAAGRVLFQRRTPARVEESPLHVVTAVTPTGILR